jgi:hypothetical protein
VQLLILSKLSCLSTHNRTSAAMSESMGNKRKQDDPLEIRESVFDDMSMAEDVFNTAWDHFLNGFGEDDSRAASENDPDDIQVDLWIEVMELLEPFLAGTKNNYIQPTSLADASKWTDRDSLLPILVSVVATLLAENYMSEALYLKARQKRATGPDQDKVPLWLQEDYDRIERYLKLAVQVRSRH